MSNTKSRNFSKLILICAATTILTGINLEAQATAKADIKEARKRAIKKGMNVEAFNNIAEIGTNAALKGKKNLKPILRDEQGKIIDAKVVEAKLNARNEAAKGQNVLRSAAEREAERAARNIIMNTIKTGGFVPHVAINPEITGANDNFDGIRFFKPILREAPNENIRKEIERTLNKVKENNSPLTLARKVQILETIKANDWHYNKDDIINIPVNPNKALPPVQVKPINVNPIIGYKSGFTVGNNYKIKYFHVRDNIIKEIDVTDNLIEAGRTFELQGIRAFRDKDLTLDQLREKEKEILLKNLKEDIRTEVINGVDIVKAVENIQVPRHQKRNNYILYYDNVVDKSEEKNEYKKYLTQAEINAIKDGRGMVLAYQEKALMIKNDMEFLTHQFQNGNLTQQQYDDKMANLVVDNYGEESEYIRSPFKPQPGVTQVTYNVYEEELIKDAKRRAVIAYIDNIERANLINDIRLTIERADGTIENITTDKFGTGIEANPIIPDLSPNPVPVARVITRQGNVDAKEVIVLPENEAVQMLQAQMAELLRENGDLRMKLRGLQEQGQSQGENRRQDQEQTGSSESFKEAEELDKEEKAKEKFIILEAQHVDEARIEALEVATMQVAVKEDEKVVATIFNSTQDIYTVSKGIVSSRINSFTAVAAGDGDERVLDKGFWISGTYGISKQGTQKGFIGYRGHTSGGTIGFDIGSDNDKDLVGIAYTRLDSKFKSNGGKLNTNVDSHIIALYGQKELPKNFMIQGMFAYNHNIVKSKINRLGTIANGKYKNNNYNFESLLSYNYLISNKVIFTPNIGIRYGYIKDGTYQESGAGIQHLSIASKKQNIWSSIVGGNVSLAPQKIGAVSITPTIMASIENYFNSKNKKLDAKIKWKDREVTEIVALPKQPKIGYNIGANILAEKGNVSVLVEYNCHLQKKYKSHQGFVKLKVKL